MNTAAFSELHPSEQQLHLHHFYDGKPIAVTGSFGYLGSQLAARLREFGAVIYRLSTGIHSAGSDHFIPDLVVEGLLSAPDFWHSVPSDTEIVFHLAAQTSAAHAEENPQLDFDANVRPMSRMIEWAAQTHKKPQVVFASTASIFGLPKSLPVSEDHPDNPETLYCLHKKMAEDYLFEASRQKTIQGTALRLSNVYGPGPDVLSQDRGLLNRMIRQALKGGPLLLEGEGSEIRDYLFVDDVLRAFLLAPLYMEQLQTQPFVIGTGEGRSFREAFALIARAAEKLTGKKVQIQSQPKPENALKINSRHFIADSTRYHIATGWTPHYNLEQGIQKTMAQFFSCGF